MYICLCNGITDRQIAEAVAGGASSLLDLKARLGIATCCGRCAECAEFILEEQLTRTPIDCALHIA
jgi:bacterioferritin-associated ferredoxin